MRGVDTQSYLIHISHCFFSSLDVIMRFKAGTRDNNQKNKKKAFPSVDKIFQCIHTWE